MAQWFAAKEAHPDALLFFRMGDFYELFFSDAEAAAAALDIALTQRGEHNGTPVPMCGVPKHAAEAYLARLIRRGYRVAVAEQMEDPKTRASAKRRSGGKSCAWSRPARSPRKRCWKPAAPTCCWRWRRTATASRRGLARRLHRPVRNRRAGAGRPARLLGRLEPAEILAPAGPFAWRMGQQARARDRAIAAAGCPAAAGRDVPAASLDAFGSFSDAEAVAAMLAVDYVRSTQAGTLPRLAHPIAAWPTPACWRWTRRPAPAWKSIAPATAARCTRCSARSSRR